MVDETVIDMAKNIASVFNVPMEWFTSPVFVINLVLPLLLSSIFFYLLLSRKLRIFRSSNTINWIFAIIMSFTSILLITINPLLSIAFFTAGIYCLLKGMGGWNIIMAIAIGVLAWWLSLQAIALIMKFFVYV
jgi:hypothetical protein